MDTFDILLEMNVKMTMSVLAAMVNVLFCRGEPTVITTVKDLSRYLDTPDASPIRFDVMAQSPFPFVQRMPLRFSAENELLSSWTAVSNAQFINSGDIVHLQGHSVLNRLTGPVLLTTNITIVGHQDLDTPLDVGDGDDLGENLYAKLIRVRGVISSVTRDDVDSSWNWITLKNRAGHIYGAIPESACSLSSLKELIDAEVFVDGLVDRPGSWRSVLGYILMILPNGIHVEKAPPKDPFAVSTLSSLRSCHRQSVHGAVIARNRSQVFIRTTDNLTIPVMPVNKDIRPAVGSFVAVAGFVEPGMPRFRLLEAVLKVIPSVSIPSFPIRDIRIEQLFRSVQNKKIASRDLCGEIIRIRGTVVRIPNDELETGILQVECDSRLISIDISDIYTSLGKKVTIGCQIEATGLCMASFDNDIAVSMFPRFRGYSIIPRQAEDIRIIVRPPWWTKTRLLVVIGLLLATVAFFAAWNRILIARSERRRRALTQERIANARAESKIEERTRLAVELHDSVSQALTGVALQIDAAASASKADDRPAVFIFAARQMLASCRKELQCCLWDLRNRTFDEKDMTEAVMRTLKPYAGDVELSIRFNVPRKNLSEALTHAILSIIRELTSNAIRHGHARHIKVAGECENDTIRFSVTDDGTGFTPDDAPGPRQGHFGLQGIRERISTFNGEFQITSVPGKTRVLTILRIEEALH